MDVERQLDGLIGRVLSWLIQPPVRPASATRTRPAAERPARKKQPASSKPAARKPAAKRPASKKPASKKPAAKRRATRKAAKKPAEKRPAADLDRFVEGTERAAAAGARSDLAAKILAALAGSAEGATLAELQSATGSQLAAVRRQLNQLLKAGTIQRGQGIGTRYRLS